MLQTSGIASAEISCGQGVFLWPTFVSVTPSCHLGIIFGTMVDDTISEAVARQTQGVPAWQWVESL